MIPNSNTATVATSDLENYGLRPALYAATEQGLSLTAKFARMRAKKDGIALVEPHSVQLPKLKAKTFFDSLPGGGIGLCTYDEIGLVIPLEGPDLPSGLRSLEELRAWHGSPQQLTTAPVSLAAVEIAGPKITDPQTSPDASLKAVSQNPASIGSRPRPVPDSVKNGRCAIEEIANNDSERKALTAFRDLCLETGKFPTSRAWRKRAQCSMGAVEQVRARLLSISSLGVLLAEDEPIISYIFGRGSNQDNNVFTDGPLQQQLEDASQSLFVRYPGQVHMLSATLSATSEGAYVALALCSQYAQERAMELLCNNLDMEREDLEFALAWEIADDSQRLHWHSFIHARHLTLTEDQLRENWLTVIDEVSCLTGVDMYLNQDGTHVARAGVNVNIRESFDPPPIGKYDFCYVAKSCKSKTPRKLSILNGRSLSPASWGFTH